MTEKTIKLGKKNEKRKEEKKAEPTPTPAPRPMPVPNDIPEKDIIDEIRDYVPYNPSPYTDKNPYIDNINYEKYDDNIYRPVKKTKKGDWEYIKEERYNAYWNYSDKTCENKTYEQKYSTKYY